MYQFIIEDSGHSDCSSYSSSSSNDCSDLSELALHESIANDDMRDEAMVKDGPKFEEIYDPLKFYFAALEWAFPGRSTTPGTDSTVNTTSTTPSPTSDDRDSDSTTLTIPTYVPSPPLLPPFSPRLEHPVLPPAVKVFTIRIDAARYTYDHDTNQLNPTRPFKFTRKIVIASDWSFQVFIGRFRSVVQEQRAPKEILPKEKLFLLMWIKKEKERGVQGFFQMMVGKGGREKVFASGEGWGEWMGMLEGMGEEDGKRVVKVAYWVAKKGRKPRGAGVGMYRCSF